MEHNVTVRIDHYPHGDLIVYQYLKKRYAFDPKKAFYHYIRHFENFHVPYILGVSPALIDASSDIDFLKSLNHAEIAMMGFSHGWVEFKNNWSEIEDYYSKGGEFSFDNQSTVYEKIVKGLYILSEFRINKFIAPFQVYTQHVLDTLNILGFESIMGGLNTIAFKMNNLEHGDLTLDLCLPPYFGEAKDVCLHVKKGYLTNNTIGLQWIYEKPTNSTYWKKTAKMLQEISHNSYDETNANDEKAQFPENGAPISMLPNKTDADPLLDTPITIVTETLNYISGGVRCIVEVLNHLACRGYKVSCHVTQSDLRCEWLHVKFPILPLKDLPKFEGIAVSPYSPTAEIVARSNAQSKFYWVHSYEPKFPELTGRSDKWRLMAENSYRIEELEYFTVSNYIRSILELIYGRDLLSPLVPGGVDTDLFKPGMKSEATLKIMFLSREHQFRGGKDIVHALKMVLQDKVNVDVYVMGFPIDMDGIPHQFYPPLPQSEFAALLGQMDIFIHASHFEGFGLPPLEAMACGSAVIATPMGASDYLLHGYNAFVVPPKRPDKIADAIKRISTDTVLRKRLQENGRETVSNSYTWEHTTDLFLEALSEGVERNNKKKHLMEENVTTFTPSIVPIESVSECRVSAIVSVYNAERFIDGCLEDLENQTLADDMEIIVIDSGSQQNEEEIVSSYQDRYDNIRYVKTRQRETVYQAWNRAIAIAKGEYITNANADDRHAPYGLQYMANILDSKPDVALVYADVWMTEVENETYTTFTPSGKYQWQDFDPDALFEKCYIGPQPMWRRRLHKTYGLFDENLTSAGDWEFWLRIAKKEKFLHIPKLLGLYLYSPESVEHRDPMVSQKERVLIQRRYSSLYNRQSTLYD